SFGEVTKEEEEFSTSAIPQLVKSARKDLFTRRKLVQALFYLATCKRHQGRERECKSLMRKCAALENPILEPEWYLARAEAVGARGKKPVQRGGEKRTA